MANKRIDNLIASGRWEIDPQFGLRELGRYLSECDLIESGTPIKEMGYAERRAALEPTIVGMNAAKISGRSGLTDPDIPVGSIAHLRLSGVMRLDGGFSSRGVRDLVSDIQAADSNPRISAILLEVDSGGGESASGTELQNALIDVNRNGRTRVGVYTQMLASAAVRGTLPAEFIIAAGGSSLVGSVGTYVSMSRELLDELKEDTLDIYARQSTEKNKEYRSLLEDDFEPLIDSLTQSAQVFIDEVFDAREITGTVSEISEVESGKLFIAQVALERGLIDGIGTFADAVNRLSQPANVENNSARPAGNLSNQSNTEMNSLTKFLTGLIPMLNTKVGTELAENATAEDVLAAVESAPGIAEVRDELKTAADEQAEAHTAAVADLSTKFDALSEKVTTLTAANESLTTAKAAMEKELADLKGTRGTVADDKTTERKNTAAAPDAGKFETVRKFGETVTTGVKVTA